jgi:hypothetical protein
MGDDGEMVRKIIIIIKKANNFLLIRCVKILIK